MSTFNDEAFRWSYALSKQLQSAHTLASNYGDLELDDELRAAVERAVRPILERRLHHAEHGGCPDPLQALAALYLDLTPGERESLNVFVETWHHHDSQAALADLVKRGLRDVVNEGADEDAAPDTMAPSWLSQVEARRLKREREAEPSRSDESKDHAPSVCELLADLDWYPPPAQLRALRRLAEARFDGDLKLALAFHFEAALEELEGEL